MNQYTSQQAPQEPVPHVVINQAPQPQVVYVQSGTPVEKNHVVAILFAIFLGGLGIDRFYLGHIGVGVAKLLTFGGFGMWWFIDIILIATKSVKGVVWVQ